MNKRILPALALCLALGAGVGAGAAVARGAAPSEAMMAGLLKRWVSRPETFQAGLIGDQEYSREGEAAFPGLIADLGKHPLAFVIHDGDFKPGSAPCNDDIYRKRRAEFDASLHPFIYTPGDNDWTDCGRATAGGFDPSERLAFLRKVFYAAPESLGREKLALTSQAEDPRFALYRENFCWTRGQVVFATLNVSGSNNHHVESDAEKDLEYQGRNLANLSWMRTAFTLAKKGGFRSVFLAMQANPGFAYKPGKKARKGFEDILACLERETRDFKGAVILMHGDSHTYRIDQPLPLRNFLRVETYGPEEPGKWILARVSPEDPKVFSFETKLVP